MFAEKDWLGNHGGLEAWQSIFVTLKIYLLQFTAMVIRDGQYNLNKICILKIVRS